MYLWLWAEAICSSSSSFLLSSCHLHLKTYLKGTQVSKTINSFTRINMYSSKRCQIINASMLHVLVRSFRGLIWTQQREIGLYSVHFKEFFFVTVDPTKHLYGVRAKADGALPSQMMPPWVWDLGSPGCLNAIAPGLWVIWSLPAAAVSWWAAAAVTPTISHTYQREARKRADRPQEGENFLRGAVTAFYPIVYSVSYTPSSLLIAYCCSLSELHVSLLCCH